MPLKRVARVPTGGRGSRGAATARFRTLGGVAIKAQTP